MAGLSTEVKKLEQISFLVEHPTSSDGLTLWQRISSGIESLE